MNDEILKAYMHPYSEQAQRLSEMTNTWLRLRKVALGWSAWRIYKKLYKGENDIHLTEEEE
jgi:hypothetical protein